MGRCGGVAVRRYRAASAESLINTIVLGWVAGEEVARSVVVRVEAAHLDRVPAGGEEQQRDKDTAGRQLQAHVRLRPLRTYMWARYAPRHQAARRRTFLRVVSDVGDRGGRCSLNECGQPNGSRLSWGRRVRGRKAPPPGTSLS